MTSLEVISAAAHRRT